MGTQQYCLKWKSHYNNMLNVFDQMLLNESLTDVTLACEGLTLKVHKVVLSACSPFFQSILAENPCQHPIIILKDFKFSELKALVDFMYHGEVNVSQEQLTTLLRTAELLKVKGLTDLQYDSQQVSNAEQSPSSVPHCSATEVKQETKSVATSKRKRVKPRHVSQRDPNYSDSEDQVPVKIPSTDSPRPAGDTSTEHSAGTDVSPADMSTYPTSFSPSQIKSSPKSSSSVLESLLCKKETKKTAESKMKKAMELEFQPSKLIEQALAGEGEPVFQDGQSHEQMFPASSQLSLLATAKLLESQADSSDHETDTSQSVSGPIASDPSSLGCAGSSNQGGQALFPARGGRNSGWTEEQMQMALSAVFTEGVPMTTAARRYGIPKTTLLYRIQNSLKTPKT